MTEWQPMATAPRDKTYVLLFDGSGFVVAFWNNGFWDDGDFQSSMPDRDFTHWHALTGPAA